MKDTFTDYRSAVAWIESGRNKTDRPIANNTRLRIGSDLNGPGSHFVAIKLHATDVVRIYETGDVVFNSGNWRTVTTADRIRYHRDFNLYSDKGIWHIYHRGEHRRVERRLRRKYGLPLTIPSTWIPGGEQEHLGMVGARSRGYGWWGEVAEIIGHRDAHRIFRAYEKEIRDKATFLFFDGIRFDHRGRCLNALTIEQEQSKTATSERLRLRIKNYARKAVHFLNEGIVVAPNVKEPWNEITEFDANYLERIMAEGEYPIRLFYDALEDAGHTTQGVEIYLGSRYDELLKVWLIGGERPGYNGKRHAAHGDIVANAIYKFIGKRLLPDRELRNAFGGHTGSKV